MADFNQPVEPLSNPASTSNVNLFSRPNWGAIWAGMFAFLGIWAVFGTLGVGVFATSANANASQPVLGMNVGIGAWIVVLTVCAFFIAGRITGGLARTQTARDGAVYGLVMFGVAAGASGVLIIIGGTALDILQVQGGVHSAYELGAFSYLGWTAFVGLFLGWIAAMAGASSAHKALPRPRPAVQAQVRHA
ncbi:MAG: hypothetical protein ACRD4R_16215 [Candidatus Acidiferrales bacterium]